MCPPREHPFHPASCQAGMKCSGTACQGRASALPLCWAVGRAGEGPLSTARAGAGDALGAVQVVSREQSPGARLRADGLRACCRQDVGRGGWAAGAGTRRQSRIEAKRHRFPSPASTGGQEDARNRAAASPALSLGGRGNPGLLPVAKGSPGQAGERLASPGPCTGPPGGAWALPPHE